MLVRVYIDTLFPSSTSSVALVADLGGNSAVVPKWCFVWTFSKRHVQRFYPSRGLNALDGVSLRGAAVILSEDPPELSRVVVPLALKQSVQERQAADTVHYSQPTYTCCVAGSQDEE